MFDLALARCFNCDPNQKLSDVRFNGRVEVLLQIVSAGRAQYISTSAYVKSAIRDLVVMRYKILYTLGIRLLCTFMAHLN